jgi:hypothetical protein
MILGGLLITCELTLGQQPPQALPVANVRPGAAVVPRAATDDSLTRFNLDFPGGTPEELVRAIERASGKPLNAIISNEHANLQLPPLRMSSVTVPALFQALEMASAKTEMYATGTQFGQGFGSGVQTLYSQFNSSYGFQTQGPLSDDSVWYFVYRKQPRVEAPKTCRIYNLAPYLESYKVEDVTTAIQTGWKMLGETNAPTISYHKDTKLLIAVGEQSKLGLIDDVLRQLSNPASKSDVKPSPPKASAAEKAAKRE